MIPQEEIAKEAKKLHDQHCASDCNLSVGDNPAWLGWAEESLKRKRSTEDKTEDARARKVVLSSEQMDDLHQITAMFMGREHGESGGSVWLGDGKVEVFDWNDQLIGHLIHTFNDGWGFEISEIRD